MINHTLKYACMGIFPSPVRKSKDTCACDVHIFGGRQFSLGR